MSPRGSQNGGHSGPRDPLGEISLGNFSGGPPEDSKEFLFDPGGLRERLGGLPGRLLEPKWRTREPRDLIRQQFWPGGMREAIE